MTLHSKVGAKDGNLNYSGVVSPPWGEGNIQDLEMLVVKRNKKSQKVLKSLQSFSSKWHLEWKLVLLVPDFPV